MESPVTMGEADDNVKEKAKHTDDDVCVNGDLACNDEPMEVCINDSKAPDSPPVVIKKEVVKKCEKVPEIKVPNEKVVEINDDDDNIELLMETDPLNDDDEKDSKSDDKKDSKLKNGVNGTIIDLNDSNEVVLVETDSEPKENGMDCSSPDIEEVINISDKNVSVTKVSDIVNLVSPVKKKPKKIEKSVHIYTPRRSIRNLNKQKSYVEKDDEEDDDATKKNKMEEEEDDDEGEDEDEESEVEEITEVDPLADSPREEKKLNKKSKYSISNSSTIVVSDTKRLVEIAANSKTSTTPSGKKEPTLVIIDTNSILSGHGPIPVTQSRKASPTPAPKSLPSTPITTTFSMMPVALPAQGVYPPNMRATITPIPMTQTTSTSKSAPPAKSVLPAPPQILPTLTDDMFVVEAPSFIVPYVYEKPPVKALRDFVLEQEKLEQIKNCDFEEELNKLNKEKENKKIEGSTKVKDEDEKKNDTKKSDVSNTDEGPSDKTKSNITNSSKVTTIDLDSIPDEKPNAIKPKSNSYFDNSLGQFFINIGFGLVQEFVQTDLLKQQKRKQSREGSGPETLLAISSLIKNLEYSKENNEPYRMEQKRCEFCSFKTESSLVLSHHLETPHMRNFIYKCNFCPLEVRSPHDILFHMEAEHNTRGRLERAPAFHQCPNCPFEDNQKGKLSRHLVTCCKKFKPEHNLAPPLDWEPPAKIPRVPRVKQHGFSATAATYQALAQAKGSFQLFSKLQQAVSPQTFPRGRGRPSLMGKINTIRSPAPVLRTNLMYRPSSSGGSVLVPTSYQFSGNQLFQVVGGQSDLGAGRLSAAPSPVALVPNLASPQGTVTIQNSSGSKTSTSKIVQQPSISITPLPRQSSSTAATSTSKPPGEPGSKATFVICEICDGYIKDLEQLRNHMQWIHKVKIHPKMIYNRPPLNCQKCQFRFFTDQGLERHLLGSHGLVTSSMQEAANKSKDAGRCPVCGRVYQWKLLNHVARDHNMTLKPAHLSYKCTVCTATFGMYKQFENHVYSAHSVVAKRVMEKKSTTAASSPSTTTTTTTTAATTTSTPTTPTSSSAPSSPSSRAGNEALLKPLKINDEITIIPQPATKGKNNVPTTRSAAAAAAASTTNTSDRGK